MQNDQTSDSDDADFYDSLHNDPPEKLLISAESGFPSVSFAGGNSNRREYRIWEGYIDACEILLDHILTKRPNSRGLIFPAMFNLRHGIELALKWHIRYAGGAIPKGAGHALEALVDAFRETAEGLDDNATYISEYDLDLISELATLDPRSVAFRYATEIDGSPISLPDKSWDLRRLCFTVSRLSLWFEHLSGYIDMSCDEYHEMLRTGDHNPPSQD